MRNKKYKIFSFPFARMMFITAGVIFLFSFTTTFIDVYYSKLSISERVDEKFSIFEKQFYDLVERDSLAMEIVLQTLAENNEIRDIYLEKDRDKLYNFTKDLFEKNKEVYGITHWYFIDKNDEIFLRVHRPELYGDKVERETYKQARGSESVAKGMEFGKTAFALRVVIPYYQDQELIGYLELGREIDDFLNTLGKQTISSFSIVVDKNMISEEDWSNYVYNANIENNWHENKDYLMIAQTYAHRSSQEDLVLSYLSENKNNEHSHYLGREDVYSVGSFNVKDALGKNAGKIYIVDDISGIIRITTLNTLISATVLLFFALFLLLTIYFILKKIVKAEKRYLVLVENVPGVVCRFEHDKKRTINFISDQILEITGFSKSEVMEAKGGFMSFVYKDDRKIVDKKIKERIIEDKSYSLDYRLRRKDKGFIWVKERGRPIYDSKHKIVYFDSIFFDISSDKKNILKMQEREEELRKINKFMIDRELKMIDLKKEINNLKDKESKNKK